MNFLWRAAPLLLAAAMLFWSGNFVIGRAVVDAVPPVLLAWFRWTGAFLVVLGLAAPHLRRDWPALRRHWFVVALLSLTGVAAFNTLVYWGLHSTTAINALLLQSATPLFILVWALVLFGEVPAPRQVLAILISFAGVAVIAGRGSLATLGALSFNRGDVLVVVAVASYAFYSALLRRRPQVHSFSLLAATFALGSLMLAPLVAWEYGQGARLHPSAGAIAAIAYICVFPSFLAYLCFNRGVELIGATRAGQFIHLMPALGTALAVVFLGESVRGFHIVGIGLIGAGLALASHPARAQAPSRASQAAEHCEMALAPRAKRLK